MQIGNSMCISFDKQYAVSKLLPIPAPNRTVAASATGADTPTAFPQVTYCPFANLPVPHP